MTATASALRILIYNWKDLAHPAAGGAEVYTEGFARELVKRGHSVTYFVSAVQGRPAEEVVEGVRIIRRGGRLGVYREAKRYWKREGDGRFDVVLDEVNTRPFMTPRFVRSTPVVCLAHQLAREVWDYEVPRPVGLLGRYLLEPLWLRRYRNVPVLTDSPSSAESFRPYGIHDAQPLPIGAAELYPRRPPKEDRPTVVFLARLVRSKRPDHAVRAFQEMVKTVSDAQMWVIGDGPFSEEVRALAGPSVEFLGRVSGEEREDRLARAHVLVATSVREGWGLNVSEASVCGTPTIGYDSPGLVDSIPAAGGHLVSQEPKELAAALVAFFEGRLPLDVRPSVATWPEVADAVEDHLTRAVAEWRHQPVPAGREQ